MIRDTSRDNPRQLNFFGFVVDDDKYRIFMVICVSINLLLSLLFILFFIYLYLVLVEVRNNTARIEAQHSRASELRSNVLCPVYGLLFDAQSADNRKTFPQGPEAYDRDFAMLRIGALSLECSSIS
jgi:hypothetical protein